MLLVNPESPTPQIVTLCHKGLTYHFQFLTFGHWCSALSARVPKCQKLKIVG